MNSYEIEVDETTLQLLKALTESCSAVGINAWFVCGAGARVLLCEKASGMSPGRATGDIDFAVYVNSYEEYHELRRYLCKYFDSHPDRHQMQRLVHKDGSLIDIVPFGAISNPDGEITLGEDNEFVMSVIGFEEAVDSAVVINVTPELAVSVVSYAEQLGLKFLAWSDRHARKSTEDSRDIAYLIRNAHLWYPESILYDQYPSILESLDFDLELMAAYALGRNFGQVFYPNTIDRILFIMNMALSDPEASILIRDIAKEFPGDSSEEMVSSRLDLIRSGIQHSSEEDESDT